MSSEFLPQPPKRIGLVLGAGGVAGMAFHAGALWALHHDLGWDARDAEVIVGTSAGSIIGSMLRAGVAPEDLAAWATDASPTAGGRKFRALMLHADRLAPVARLPSPTLPGWVALGTFAHPTQLRAALTSMLPHGLADQTPRLAIVDRLLPEWPSKPLWISAVRVGDGRLTWFGRTDPAGAHTGPDMRAEIDGRRERVRPADAVAASCAIPVLARPVQIGRHRYIDGGVHSPTSADALAEHDLDLVIVLSPMGHIAGEASRSPARRLAQRRLQREVRLLRARNMDVQVISPDASTIRMMGWNMLERDNSGRVMRTAFLGTSPQLHPDVNTLLRRTRTAADVA